MAQPPTGSAGRILVVAGEHLADLLADHLLPERGLEGMPVDLGTVLATRGPSIVLLYHEAWTDEAARIVRRLDEANHGVYLICQDAANPDLNLAMLEAGAIEATIDREPMMRLMVCRLSRRLAEQPTRWRANAVVVDVVEGWAQRDDERPIHLTQTEAQLFRHLYIASRARKGLFAIQLANKLHTSEPVVYNHIRDLRAKLEDDPRHPCLLTLDSKKGYRLNLD